MAKQPMSDVIVLLPGITGSVLQRNGKDVWAINKGAIFNALSTLGKSLEEIEIKGEDDPNIDDLGDGIVATRLMPDIHLIPGFWSIDGYGKIRETIFHRFEVVENQNYFEFPYDWRRPNQVSARRLARESEKWLSQWKQRSGNDDARLILVGHSMGGLVSRWFLEHLAGWKRTRSLITFGTPYRGAVNAIDSLVHGLKKKIGPFTALDLTPALRSFDSVYQLLPIYPCVDLGDGALVRVAETDQLPGVQQARAGAALNFHHAIRDAVSEHQEDQDYVTDGYRIHPITGMSQPTKQSVRLEQEKVVSVNSHKGKDYSGDGTVPRVSALPIEITDGQTGMFTGEKHGSIQNDGSVLMHLRGLLTGRTINFNDFERFDEAEPVTLGVQMDEIFSADEPIAITAIANAEGLSLSASATNVDSGETTLPATLTQVADDRYEVAMQPLPAGMYRVTITLHATRESVTEIVAVV
jgi:pimeloyl-ACP methyl ester carboxylesterase